MDISTLTFADLAETWTIREVTIPISVVFAISQAGLQCRNHIRDEPSELEEKGGPHFWSGHACNAGSRLCQLSGMLLACEIPHHAHGFEVHVVLTEATFVLNQPTCKKEANIHVAS